MKKLIIRLLIFLCIFTVGAIFVTYLSIENINEKNNFKIENVEIDKGDNSENEKSIDLYGTYDQNDLIINELVEDYNGVEIKIPKIEGLKNSKVQDKVNESLYSKFYELVNKYKKVNYANFYTRANFANVLSIVFYVANDNSNEQLYLTYNLVDGEELKLEDLFIKGTDIKEIVRQAFYETMARENRFYSEDYNDIISPNEEELYKVVKGYISNKNKVFSLTPSEICFYYDDYMASVKMIYIYDKVSIYSKYLTDESLYINNDIGYKDIITCANGSYDIFEEIDYGYLEDNLWYDVTLWSYDRPEDSEKLTIFNEFKKKFYDKTYDKVYKYREVAQNNPDKFYIVFSKPTVNIYSYSKYENREWKYTYSNMATVNENIQVFEMPMEVYKKIYRDKLIDTYRYEYFEMRGGAYLDTDVSDGATITKLDRTKLYNYMTGEEIKAVEDVFYEDSNYINVIKDKTKESLMNKYNYSEEDTENLLKTIDYELDGTQVNVTIPTLKDFMVIIYFNDFDVSMMKIFDI